MSQATRLSALATAVGAEIKDVRADIAALGGGGPLPSPLALSEGAEPSTPASGSVALYSVDGSALLMKSDAGVVTQVSGGQAIGSLSAASALTGTEIVPLVQSGTTKRTTAADIAALAAASGSEVVKTVAATRTNATTTGAAISDFTTSLTPGTYRIRADLIWRSAATGAGAGFWINASGGAVSRNVGHVYTTSTGTTATTGVADQATAAASFQMIEARAWRANNTDPGPFGGVDTAASDQLCIMEAIVVVTTTTSLQIMFDSEDTTQMAIQAGSVLQIKGPT
jgi:hypothetical protein